MKSSTDDLRNAAGHYAVVHRASFFPGLTSRPGSMRSRSPFRNNMVTPSNSARRIYQTERLSIYNRAGAPYQNDRSDHFRAESEARSARRPIIVNSRGRVIAVGDIHGCALEFETLLDKLALTRSDRLILLGDLVNRGPDSAGVIALARRHAHRALLGNHELRLLNYRRTGDPSHLKKSDYETLHQLGADDWSYLAQMPLTYPVPELDTVLVHGGFLPDRPWRGQPGRVVTRIQVVGPDGEPHKASDYPGYPHWSDLWRGPPFVIYGHTPRIEPKRLTWSLGIDTGCVRGGALTACVLPGREIVQVRSAECWAKAM